MAVKSPAVVRAFATVPRERFLGPGPWLICTGEAPNKYWSTEDDDPRCVYHNVVIGMLTEKGLNNGQPGFWAYLFDRLDLAPGKRVLHLGCGAGYYSAILAEIVGPSGQRDGRRSWRRAWWRRAVEALCALAAGDGGGCRRGELRARGGRHHRRQRGRHASAAAVARCPAARADSCCCRSRASADGGRRCW